MRSSVGTVLRSSAWFRREQIPHSFQPGAQDIARIADADLVMSVGLRLEESWLKELLENAARDPAGIVEMGELIDPIEFSETHAEDVEFLESLAHIVHEVEEGEISPEEGLEEIKELMEGVEDHGDEEEEDEPPAMVDAILDQVEAGQLDAGEAIEEIEHIAGEGEEEHEGHGHGVYDPHFWFDPLRVKTAVNEIAARLSAIDPDSSGIYAARLLSTTLNSRRAARLDGGAGGPDFGGQQALRDLSRQLWILRAPVRLRCSGGHSGHNHGNGAVG